MGLRGCAWVLGAGIDFDRHNRVILIYLCFVFFNLFNYSQSGGLIIVIFIPLYIIRSI
jgi:hypothetical protein